MGGIQVVHFTTIYACMLRRLNLLKYHHLDRGFDARFARPVCGANKESKLTVV